MSEDQPPATAASSQPSTSKVPQPTASTDEPITSNADILASLTARLNVIEQQIKVPVLPTQAELPKAPALRAGMTI